MGSMGLMVLRLSLPFWFNQSIRVSMFILPYIGLHKAFRLDGSIVVSGRLKLVAREMLPTWHFSQVNFSKVYFVSAYTAKLCEFILI